jgi:hypothetical protein
MFLKEDEDSLSSETQQMSLLVDDKVSDTSQQKLPVPQVYVSCTVIVLFVFTVGKHMINNLQMFTFETDTHRHILQSYFLHLIILCGEGNAFL